MDNTQTQSPARISRTSFYCEKRRTVIYNDDGVPWKDEELVATCDTLHDTLGQARSHCRKIGFTHTVEWTAHGYDEEAYRGRPATFVIEDDDFKVRPITASYRDAR